MEGQESRSGERLAQTLETNEKFKLIIAHHERESKPITVNVLHDSVLHIATRSLPQ